MKNVTELINEGILDDVETTMARGEKDAKYILAQQTLINNVCALDEINSNRYHRDKPSNPINADLFGNKLEIGDLVYITTPENFYDYINCQFAIVCGFGKSTMNYQSDTSKMVAIYHEKSYNFNKTVEKLNNGEFKIDFSNLVDIDELGRVIYLNGKCMIRIAKKNNVASMLKKLKNI